MAEMMLQLADPALPAGYQFVSIGGEPCYMREDVFSEYQQLSKRKKGGFFKKLWDLNKKLALAPMRRSFRTLVAINVHGMAKKLMNRIQRGGEEAVKNKWEKIGGKYSELLKSIKAGAKRKALLENFQDDEMLSACAAEFPVFQKNLIQYIKNYKRNQRMNGSKGVVNMSEQEQLGVVQLAAVLAAAVPIIAALAPLMKKKAGDPADPAGSGMPVEEIVSQAKDAAKAAGVPDEILNSDPTGKDAHKFDKQEGVDDAPKKDGSDKIFGMPKIAVVGAGAAAAIYLLTKKK